jgi:penicillin amidase
LTQGTPAVIIQPTTIAHVGSCAEDTMTTPRRLAAGLLFILIPLLFSACSASDATEAAAPASVDELARQSLARIDGELSVPGLKEPVEIIRDQAGIPHIYAKNDDDMFFAQGYVMGQDRLWQLEMWRRWREGRLAEIFGPKAYDFDARTRLMMFRGPWDEKEWGSYHKDAERLFTAWANGLNAYVAQNADNLPAEFKLTGIKPEPWTARTLTLRWAEVGLDSAGSTPLEELRLAQNVARLGVQEANKRAAPDPWDDLVVPEGLDVKIITDDVVESARKGEGNPFGPNALPPLDIVPQYRQLVPVLKTAGVLPELQDMDGSNNWVVSGKLSPTGVPILSNDPHRTIEMPSLRYFVHLVSPGWNVIGGGEPPFVGVDAGSNDSMAWGFTFAGIDMVDTFVEETNPADPNQTRYNGNWEPMRIIREEINVKGESAPRVVELKFTRHGPVFHEDVVNHRAYVAKSVNQEPGTAAFKGSLKLAQATSCEDFFDRAMYWKVPTHNLICGDKAGNIALQVSGLTPDRTGWSGRLPVPGTGKYDWKGFRSDLPREYNPERGFIATANDNTHPPGYKGRPVLYRTSVGVEVSRIARIRQMLSKSGAKFTVQDHERMQHDAYSLRAERDLPLFRGWKSKDPDVERARAMIESWDKVMSRDTTPGAIYVRWTATDAARGLDGGRATGAKRRELVETGLRQAIDRLTKDWGSDWSQWRYGRINRSDLPHMFVPAFSLPAVERPGGFNTVNATGANFRRIIDLSNVDNSVATNAPGQSAQPGSPYYGNNRERLANGEYFPLPYTRGAVDKLAAHRLTIKP